MKKTIPSLLLSLVFVLSAVALPTSVLAHGQAPAERGNERHVETQANAEERREQVQQRREARTADIRERVEERRAQILQDVCERREEQLNALVPRLANQSTRAMGAIDGVYERVQGFYESGQLTVTDYDAQNSAVAEAQAEAQAAVEVATAYEFEFDCENPSLGDQLFGFREAITEARDALKAYRSELVGLISSLRAAAAEDAGAVGDQIEPETEAGEENDGEETNESEEDDE